MIGDFFVFATRADAAQAVAEQIVRGFIPNLYPCEATARAEHEARRGSSLALGYRPFRCGISADMNQTFSIQAVDFASANS